MVFMKFLCVIEVMALISHVRCMAAGYGRDETCDGCQREPPCVIQSIRDGQQLSGSTEIEPIHKESVEEEDLFHLKHADPCHRVSKNDPGMKRNDALAIRLCKVLSQLYFQSELFKGGQQSSICKEYTHHGCTQVGFDMEFHCMVHIESSTFDSSRRLSSCVEEDLKRYRARTQIRGAQYDVNANPEIQRKYGSLNVTLGTSKAAGQSRSPIRNSGGRGRSTSPPARADQGRTSSFRRHFFGSFRYRRSRKPSSQSAMNPAVTSSTMRPPSPSGKFKYH